MGWAQSTRHIPQLLQGKISAVLNSHQLVLVHDMVAVIVVVTQDSGWSRKRRREVVGVYTRVRRNVWIPTSVYLNWTALPLQQFVPHHVSRLVHLQWKSFTLTARRSNIGSAMKKWKSENLAFNCSYKQHYVSNKQLRIQISEITARCSAIASRKSLLSWPLTLGLNKTYFQQLAGSWQFVFFLRVLSTVPAVLATAQIGKLTFTSKCFRTSNE